MNEMSNDAKLTSGMGAMHRTLRRVLVVLRQGGACPTMTLPRYKVSPRECGYNHASEVGLMKRTKLPTKRYRH